VRSVKEVLVSLTEVFSPTKVLKVTIGVSCVVGKHDFCCADGLSLVDEGVF